MSVARKLLFSLLTLGVILLLAEVAARVAWWRLEHRAFEIRHALGEAALRNDGINFMKQADRTFGYVLIPGIKRRGHEINADGFEQRDRVPVSKRPGVIRLAAMGESTTQGQNTENGNYPVYLGEIVRKRGRGYADVEVINAGVAGWTSDQVALWSEKKVGQYSPDIVVLYVGWNDFQSYDPFRSPPAVSNFESTYGSARFIVDSSPLKLVPLSSAVYEYAMRRLWRSAEKPELTDMAREDNSPLRYASPRGSQLPLLSGESGQDGSGLSQRQPECPHRDLHSDGSVAGGNPGSIPEGRGGCALVDAEPRTRPGAGSCDALEVQRPDQRVRKVPEPAPDRCRGRLLAAGSRHATVGFRPSDRGGL
jgi:hypothetical protein